MPMTSHFAAPSTPSPTLPDSKLAPAPAGTERKRKLIRQCARISLDAGNRARVYSRRSRRVRETGKGSLGAHLDSPDQAMGTAAETGWQPFVNGLTTKFGSFFRENHFEALVQDLRACAANKAARAAGAKVRTWCNAVGTGEEPYALATAVAESLGPAAPVQRVCSDIDTQVLATTQRVAFATSARGQSPESLKRHSLRGIGANAGFIRARPELARLIEFRSFNLVSASCASLGEPFDAVFCRSVVRYFNAPTQRQVLERIHAAMRSGGLLHVRHLDNFCEALDLFRLRGRTIYERAQQ